jgi:multidrug efflux system outer membrane protein
MSRVVRAAALTLLAAPLFACAPLGQDYARPETTLPAVWEASGRASSAPAGQVRAEWWKTFNDATLDELVASARERNVDARIALAQLEEAQALLREAHASLFPQVDLGNTAARSRITTLGGTPLPATVAPIRNDFRLSASTAFELDFWGRVRRAEEAARAQLLSTQYARDVAELSAVSGTVQTYVLLRSLDAQVAVARSTARVREESLAVARARHRAGLASEIDLRQAEGASAEASAQITELERQRRQVLGALSAFVGRPGLALVAGDLQSMPVPAQPPAGLPSALLDRRPDVRAAEQALVAANARVGVAKAAMMPTISLTGALGGQSRDLSDLLLSGARIWSLGFGLTLPLFDAGRLEARADQADARRRQALANYQKAAENAYREVSDALSGVEASAASERDAEIRRDAARQTVRLARLRWEAGHAPYLEVLDAQRALNDAELTRVRVRQSRLSYSVDLAKALGGGWAAAQ